MYITADDIKNEISFYHPIDNRLGDKKIGLIQIYFVYSFYNVEQDEKIYLKNGETLKVKRGYYTMKDIEKVSSGKVKYDSLTGKSVIDASISRFGPYMNKILGISNGNCIDTLLSKKMFSFRINKLSNTTSNISLEFDTIINASLASQIRTEYMTSSILYDRILRARIIPLNKSDTSFSVDINSPSKSLKGVLLIFTQERSATKFARDAEEFYNPKITKVEVTVEGVPNELYAQNMEYRHQYDEIVKHFAEGRLKEAGAIQKDLQLHNVNIASYCTDKYALWLDFQTIDDNRLHGSGRRLENTSEGIRLQITKKAESAGKLSCYLYIFQDAQINISDAQFLNVVY